MRSRRFEDEIRRRCERWTPPLGPFLTADDVYSEMKNFATELGPHQASSLVETISTWDVDSDIADTVFELAREYMNAFPAAFTEALLSRLERNGPAVLVDILGMSEQPEVSRELLDRLDVEQADDDLLVALFGALGSIADVTAHRFLQSVDAHLLSPRARRELEIARRNSSRKNAPAT